MSILDQSFDDLPDLAGYALPDPGVYKVTVTTTVKKVNDKDAVEAEFTVTGIVEQAAGSKPPVIGDKFSTLFMLENEYGVGNMKKFLAPFVEHFNQRHLATLVRETVKDVACQITLAHRKDKNDPEKVYPQIKYLTVE